MITTPTTLPSGSMVIYHPIVHQGPAIVVLVALTIVGGLCGGALAGFVFYAHAAFRFPYRRTP